MAQNLQQGRKLREAMIRALFVLLFGSAQHLRARSLTGPAFIRPVCQSLGER